jgi:hypothetical protein
VPRISIWDVVGGRVTCAAAALRTESNQEDIQTCRQRAVYRATEDRLPTSRYPDNKENSVGPEAETSVNEWRGSRHSLLAGNLKARYSKVVCNSVSFGP